LHCINLARPTIQPLKDVTTEQGRIVHRIERKNDKKGVEATTMRGNYHF